MMELQTQNNHYESIVVGNATERLAVEKRKSKSKPKSKAHEKSKTQSKTVESGAKANHLTKPDNVAVASKSVAKILELAIFVDEAAVKLFMPYLGLQDYAKLRELILAFVNGVSWTNYVNYQLTLFETIKSPYPSINW